MVLGIAFVLLEVAQLGLIVAAFSRVIDPGPQAFDAIGTLAGCGVAVGCAVVLATTDVGRRPWLRMLTFVAVMSGFASAGTWLSLFGCTLLLNDVSRIAVLVASDLVVAIRAVAGALTVRGPRLRPPGFSGLAVGLSIRAAAQAALFLGSLGPGATGLARWILVRSGGPQKG